MKVNRIKHRIKVYAPIMVATCAIMITVIPWYGAYLGNKSLKYAELGYHVDASHTAQSAISYNPLSIQAFFILAGTENRIGREADARAALIRATELQPQNYETWLQLALYERDHWNEPEKAREHFIIATNLNPYDKYLMKEAGLADADNLE